MAEEVATNVIENIVDDIDQFFSMVTFHQSYGYEDFIEGIKAETEDGQVSYHVEDGIFKKFCLKAQKYPEEKFLFVIDEINRGNISKIFGELITLIEPSKRLGAEEEMQVTLPYSKEKFGVPANVHILATMNTADRSIAMMDTALRRRFDFVEMLPNPAVVSDCISLIDGYDIANIMDVLNKRIEVLYDREHTLGHAFFLPVSNLEDLKGVFEGKIIPTLQEYFYEDYDKIRAILNDTRGIYIKIKEKEYDLFDPQFSDLLSDYDETKFSIEKNVTMENFKLFLDNIITRNVQAYEN